MDLVQISEGPTETRVAFGAAVEISVTRILYTQLTPLLARPVALAVDAGQVERIDAAGLQLLFCLSQSAHQRAIPLRWHAVSPVVRQAAQRAGIDSALFTPA